MKDAKTVEMLTCRRCGHQWLPRRVGVRPFQCPHPDCRTSLWDREDGESS